MRIALLLTVISLCLGRALVARADDAGAHDNGGADDAAYEGFITEALSAYDAGRWAEARASFRRAHELAPTARTFRTIGMCSFNLGDYVDALQNLESALIDVRKPLTAEQHSQIAGLIERGNAKLGRFRLKLVPDSASVRVDGAAPALLAGHELLLEPGHHEIVASASGYRSIQRELGVEPGDRATLDMQLEAGTLAPTAAASSVAPTAAATATAAPEAASAAAPHEPPASHGNTQRVLGFVGIGLGGAGLVSFGVAGGLALGKKSTLQDACPSRKCGPAQHANVDSYDRLRMISTVGLIAGGALLSLGLALLLTAPASASAEHASLTPELGLGWVGLRGQL